ncbi:MAG: acetolactate synthase small subunit [Oscillospiraceae bacterium]|nr:acetolactate synthase small subunit [Oscillospiraceae bacterium]
MEKYILFAEVRDTPGVVSRVSGFFTRRGYNIESFVTSKTEREEVTLLTFVVQSSPEEIKILVHQMKRIEDIISVFNASETNVVMREFMLIKIKCPKEKDLEIMQVCQMLDIKILGREKESVTVEAVGSPHKLDDIALIFKSYGIEKIVRSGPVCVTQLKETD